ncbi:class I glutamine amidotransferase-like protein [Radiomyces spectabilis]|uniref:class I glutamine amidotransferase-like protein n=1 Tax=Radiomyces spectabilis TaxID=64574 RepID=UPI0022205894|nr:class I glutamine amidotransferase-like protein [Radiomyces spectabilis]KAI8391358.1 class I glutamine amidotransferase-like protein [Radiomyces spectabilis]
MSGKKVIVFLADGTEEMEFTITVDVLRRAQLDVTVVGVQLAHGTYAECSRKVKIVPDVLLEHEGQSWNRSDYEAAVIPGGAPGANTMKDNVEVQDIISLLYEKQKIVAFICAGTLVAKAAKIPEGHKVTSYPGVKDQLTDVYKYSEDRVVVDQNVITSRGPGTAMLFALTIVEQLLDKQVVEKLKQEMLTASTL